MHAYATIRSRPLCTFWRCVPYRCGGGRLYGPHHGRSAPKCESSGQRGAPSGTSPKLQIFGHRDGFLSDRRSPKIQRTLCDLRPSTPQYTPKEWKAFTDDFQQTLDEFKVPVAALAELEAIVQSTYGYIVVAEV
jgi:hypothetical protein